MKKYPVKETRKNFAEIPRKINKKNEKKGKEKNPNKAKKNIWLWTIGKWIFFSIGIECTIKIKQGIGK